MPMNAKPKHLRSDDKDDDDNALIPFNLVQFNLMPQFCFFLSSFGSLLALFGGLVALPSDNGVDPLQLPSFRAC